MKVLLFLVVCAFCLVQGSTGLRQKFNHFQKEAAVNAHARERRMPSPDQEAIGNVPQIEDSVASAEYRRVEGDMLPDNVDSLTTIRYKRGAPETKNPDRKWPLDQVISYRIESVYDAPFAKSIRDAFQFWSDNTCLNFQEDGPTTPLIRVLKGKDCSSQLGRQSGASQRLNLDDGCQTMGTIAHEIAHSMGLAHTQMRADRDDYITVRTENINQTYIGNFRKMTPEENDNFGVEYDYSSVLHYDPSGFAIDSSLPTITTNDPYAQRELGQREKAAFSDVKLVNAFYDCAQKCPSPSVTCQNSGIINSKTCDSCICPPMFTGDDCSERQPSTGKYANDSCGADLTVVFHCLAVNNSVFQATDEWQNVQGSFGPYGIQYPDDVTQCFWNFMAPEGRKIEIRMNQIDMWCNPTCKWNVIEIFMRGFTSGGYRFCCKEEINGKVFESLDNGASIRLAASYHIPMFDVDYRMI